MERAILIAIALFGLVVWRVVFTLLEQWPSPRATPPPRQRKDTLAKQRRPHWLLPCVELTTGIGWGPGSSRIDLVQAESRADMYLRRVIALTGATQNGKSYFLDVDTTRFQVWDRFIMRLRDSADPKGRYYEETCFGPAFQGMPRAERIATVLLQLRNNPELFEKWVKKETAFKADGQPAVPPWGGDDIRMRAQTKDAPLDRAEEYLRRIAQLTGARHTPEGYRLRAGGRDFLVDSKFVRVLSHHRKYTCISVGTDPDMPSAEIVASARLQLKSDPKLFRKWRNRPGYLFKANGKAFRSVRRCNWFEI